MGEESLTPEQLAAVIAKLEANGYVIKRRPPLVKKTMEIEEPTWNEADAIRKTKKITAREMLLQALTLWIEKEGKR